MSNRVIDDIGSKTTVDVPMNIVKVIGFMNSIIFRISNH